MEKVKKWLENYWYHYKWTTIIVCFFVICLAVMLNQCSKKENFDFSVIYAGPFEPNANQTQSIENELAKMIDNDVNGDGKKNCQLNNFFLMSDEQFENMQDYYDSEGEIYVPNRNAIAANKEQFSNQVFAGDSSICILDPYWYDMLKEQNAFVALADLLGETPDYAVDEFSCKLSDTPFAKYFSAIQVFPKDSVLCFRNLSTATAFKNKEKSEQYYEDSKEFFINIMNFEIKK